MKKSELLAASMLAASATATATAVSTVTTTTTTSTFTVTAKPSHQEVGSSEDSTKEKFAPRFDGLRFIETLVTAHR